MAMVAEQGLITGCMQYACVNEHCGQFFLVHIIFLRGVTRAINGRL